MDKNGFVMKVLICLFILLFTLMAGAERAFAAEDQAESLWELGEKAYAAGRHQDARSYYERSLAKCAGDLECVASNLNGIGAVYEALDNDSKAFKYYEDALAAARKINNRDLIATNLFNTGAIYHRTFNQYEKALDLFEESLNIFRELKDSKSAAIVLFNMGKALNSLGRYEKSLAALNESLRMNREANNQQGVAGSLMIIGNVYSRLGQYDKLLPYYQEALRINRQLNNQSEIATALRNMGDAYCDLMEYDKLLACYQEALDIQKRHNLRFDMALTYTSMGAFYKDINQYDKALSYFEKSLKLSREFDNDALIATNLNNLGNVQANLGKSDNALSCFQQALTLEKRLNRPHQTAIILNNIGMEYFRLGLYEQAIDELNKALAIERKLNNPHQIAARLNNIGAAYLRQGRYGEAENVFLERKNMQRKMAKTRLIHAGLIEVYLATKRYDEALASLKELPPNWKDNSNRRMEYHTQYGLALKGKGDLRQSAQELLKAVRIVEDVRRSVSERSDFFAGSGYIGRLTPYRELVVVLSEMALRGERQDDLFQSYGRDPASNAFYFTELAKARTLLELMAGAVKKYDDPAIPSEIKSREAEILQKLSAIEDQWENAYARGGSVFNSLTRRKEELRRELDTVVSTLRKKYPAYAAVNYPKPMPAEELPMKDNEVLIEFGINHDEAIAFVSRKGGVTGIHRINISGDALSEKVRDIVDPLTSGRHSGFSMKKAKELYDILLSDVLKDVKDTERLIIVPDGILGVLPFEALVIKVGGDYGNSTYVGDQWAVTYAQSATSLALTRFFRSAEAGKPLFALGNPIYNFSDPRYIDYKQGKSQTIAGRNPMQYAYRGVAVIPKKVIGGETMAEEDVFFPPLPETEDEVRAIAGFFSVKPEPPDVLLGLSATESNFRNAILTDYRYLHFATHADLPGKIQGIKEPFIIMGQVENRATDDGFLTLSEVLGLKLNADMVVLSACSTGKGKMTEGEGVASFARAFQHAGAKSVVVSLWEVASDAAVAYMKSFYSLIESGVGKAEALKLTRKAIRAKYPNPFYWSVFVLYGEG